MNRKSINLIYCAVQGFFWMGLGICINFAAVFLQYCGFSNSELGLIMALGNVASILISALTATIVDSFSRRALARCIWVLYALQALCLGVCALFPGRTLLIAAVYCIYMGCVLSINPLNTEICARLSVVFGDINYGVARGMGSVAFALMAAVMGVLMNSIGASTLPIAGLVFALAQAVLLAVVSPWLSKAALPGRAAETGALADAGAGVGSETESGGEQASGFLAFMRENKRFCVLMLGVSALFLSNNLSNNFLINVVRNVGGDEAALGGITAFMAITEVPVMFLYDRITRRVSCPATMRIAAAFFVMKGVAILCSGSVGALYAAHSFQALSFAMVIPAMVRYVNLYIAPKDSAKGQSLSFATTSLGSIFASSLGGPLYDGFGVSAALTAAVFAAALGAVVCFVFARPRGHV